jgi:hypothetical protein
VIIRARSAPILLILFFLTVLPFSVSGKEHEVTGPRILSHVARGAEGVMYALSTDRGALVSRNRGKDWSFINGGLPKEQVWPFEENSYRSFTSLSVDAENPLRIAATTSTSLFLSDDGGEEWKHIDLRDPVKSSNYLTAVSFDIRSPGRIYLGTSFNGLFVSDDGGKSWEKISHHLDPIYRGAGFYEEITDLAMVPGYDTDLFIAVGFDHGIFRYNTKTLNLEKIDLPVDAGRLTSINNYRGGLTENPALEVHFEQRRYILDLDHGTWQVVPPLLLVSEETEAAARLKEAGTVKVVRSIYLNAYNARGESLKQHILFLKEHGFNSIVVDLKDDWGRLTYDSRLPIPREIDAVHPVLDLDELIRQAHAAGIYVIGRMVVFKDKRVHLMEGGKYAIWDSARGRPWAHLVPEEREIDGKKETVLVQREFWTDPYSEFVWDYNIDIALELQERGIDEVQFDYIRFPSDGDLGTALYRYRRPGMLRTEAIESFIKKAGEKLSLPISVDLYGFNSWYRMGNWIGQDIEMLSRYVDVICPMYYPSHFPADFLPGEDYITRAYELYRIGTERARSIVRDRSRIRPYVQAFLMGRELSMEEAEYQRYLNVQLEGVLEAGGCGYTLWNNMNRYYMVNGRVSELNVREFDDCGEEALESPSS